MNQKAGNRKDQVGAQERSVISWGSKMYLAGAFPINEILEALSLG